MKLPYQASTPRDSQPTTPQPQPETIKMKFLFVLAVAVVCAACVFACDPNSNNMPTCTTAMEGQQFRNFWDPTAYWTCSKGVAVLVRCGIPNGAYDSAKQQCVAWSEWSWTEPCPGYYPITD